MIDVGHVLDAVGRAVLTVRHRPDAPLPAAADVVIADQGHPPGLHRGDVVLGIGIRDAETARTLVEACAEHGAAAVLLRPPLASDDPVLAAAQQLPVALVEVDPRMPWAQLAWLRRTAIDDANLSRTTGLDPAREFGDLFDLADTIADVLDSPVTIEDRAGRMLAYSARQEGADDARIATIMGRSVPESHRGRRGRSRRGILVRISNQLSWRRSGRRLTMI